MHSLIFGIIHSFKKINEWMIHTIHTFNRTIYYAKKKYIYIYKNMQTNTIFQEPIMWWETINIKKKCQIQ